MTLTSDRQNCDSLTRVSIPLETRSTSIYFIEFHNPSGAVIQWVHVAEVRFSDQPLSIATAIAFPEPMATTPTGKKFYAQHDITVNHACTDRSKSKLPLSTTEELGIGM